MPDEKQSPRSPAPVENSADPALDALAQSHGIAPTRPEPDGTEVPVSDETKRKLLAALNVDIEAEKRDGNGCFLPDFLRDAPVWGISIQLYELRSPRNWGIGDFADLSELCAMAGDWGADFVGLNPLHAPFLADPARCSPYEPSNKHWLNPLYIAVDRLEGWTGSAEEMDAIAALRTGDLVDYRKVADLKMTALRRYWRDWRGGNIKTSLLDASEFEQFELAGGESLRLHALFEVISAEQVRTGGSAGWRDWPEELQDPQNAAVREFAQSRLSETEFYIWLQWIAHLQLEEAAQAARHAGLRIGLYLDLAVGEALDGSATWSERDVYVASASVGGPPDPWAITGQDWRLAAYLPNRIADGEPSPYRSMIDSAMRYAGAIRIDHAAALSRLFLVPFDGTPADGAYVDYPKADLIKVLQEASHTHRSIVIGEDLGNLPEGLKEDLQNASILSYRIFSYEKDDDGFIPAEDYPELALACVSTHDHQTLEGWWKGSDVQARIDHHLVPAALAQRDLHLRKQERREICELLESAGFKAPDPQELKLVSQELDRFIIDLHTLLAQGPSLLFSVRLADLTKEPQPTNIPGTSTSHPNWRTRLSVMLEDLDELPLVQDVTDALRRVRPKSF